MRKGGNYVNRWPSRIDLEDLLYRPLLLRWLPGVFGWLSALFGENRLTIRICRSVFAFGRWAAALFGENRLSAPVGRAVVSAGQWIARLFGENRLTAPVGRAIVSAGQWISGLFGENRVTAPLSKGILRIAKTVSHACSDSLDAIILLLTKTLNRQTRERSDDRVTGSVSYRVGKRLDAAAIRRGREEEGAGSVAAL